MNGFFSISLPCPGSRAAFLMTMAFLAGCASGTSISDRSPGSAASGNGTASGPVRVPSDIDSDGDYLSNEEEAQLGTDPNAVDSDGDGYSDFAEVRGFQSNPTDPNSALPDGDFYLELPFEGDRETRMFKVKTRANVADVFLLMDTSHSMRLERTVLIKGMVSTVIPGIKERIRDAEVGLGGFSDYPYKGYGTDQAVPGAAADLPFFLLRRVAPINEDVGAWSLASTAEKCPPVDENGADVGTISGSANGVPDIVDAVQGLPCKNGRDDAESHVPALWSTVSGQALMWPRGTTEAASCDGSRVGVACFRPGVLPIVVLIAEFPFHNGPTGGDRYGALPGAPTYAQALASLKEIGARVISIESNNSGRARPDYHAIARDTGAVNNAGEPLVYTVREDGTGIDQTVVDAIAELVDNTTFDITTRLENVAGNPDDFDATQFIKSLTPERYDRPEAGTELEFTVEFENDVRPPADEPQFFKARIVIVGDNQFTVDERIAYILVPPDGGQSDLQ